MEMDEPESTIPLIPRSNTDGSFVDVDYSGFAHFRWRLSSVLLRVTPKLIVDKVDRCTLGSQMEPEDMYRFIPSPSGLGSSSTGFCCGPRRPLLRVPPHVSFSTPLCCWFSLMCTLHPHVPLLALLELRKGP